MPRRKGVRQVYPSYQHVFYNYSPYAHAVNSHLLQPTNYFDVATNSERIFGPWFPPQSGSMGQFPPGPPQGRPPFIPPGQSTTGGPPTSPPPATIPTQTQQIGIQAVDPGAIRGCLYRFTYVWLNNGQQFWFFPTFVGRTSIAGYRWIGFMWIYFGTDLRRIQSFQCV
jgi:hypothetical protein